MHVLNATGYGVVFLLGLLLLLAWRREVFPAGLLAIHESRLCRRWRQPLPLAFLVLTGLMILGGILHAPSNYDGMTYRIPRVLHWLAADQWHWIHTVYPRLNARACGSEWVSAPLLLFTHSDRLLFLVNVISYLLMPGLVFSVFTRLGVHPRVAWYWMWIVPTGYCFLLQGGSSGNDLFGAPFVLAAVDFALRARTSHRARDFFGSLLAVALMTSAKTSNLPLLLVWGVAIMPSWRLVFQWPVRLAAVCLVTAACSFLPTALLNQYYSGDWSGVKAEGVCVKSDPPLRLASNLAVTALQNLNPPVFPLAGQWNTFVTNQFSPELRLRLSQTVVESGAVDFHTEEMPVEENAGLGFGVCLILLLSVVAAIGHRGTLVGRGRVDARLAWWLASLRWLPLAALLALLSQSQVAAIARILTPYYALLLPVCLAGPGQAWVVRQHWWRAAVAMSFLLAALLLVISPPRPLFPAITIFSRLHARHPESRLLTRADTIYSVYGRRNEAFAPVLAELPPDLKILGIFTYDDPETSLWRPFGSRLILHVRPEDSTSYLKQQGIEYILINSLKFPTWFHITPAEWVQNQHATVVKKIPLTQRASEGSVDWWLVKLP